MIGMYGSGYVSYVGYKPCQNIRKLLCWLSQLAFADRASSQETAVMHPQTTPTHTQQCESLLMGPVCLCVQRRGNLRG